MNQYYGMLRDEGVRLHVILGNEVDADYEGGLSPSEASAFYAESIRGYRSVNQDIIHVPAPTGAPSTHREHLEQFKADGWVQSDYWIDGHGYNGDLENVLNVLHEVFPDQAGYAITETNNLDNFAWPISLIDSGKANAIVYFILNWARGGIGREQPPTADDANKQMSLMRFPARYQQFRDTLRDTNVVPSPPPVDVPDPPPAPPIQPEPEPMSDPWRFFDAATIANATGCPEGAIRDHWPRLHAQLSLCGLDERPIQVAMIGTVAIESASTFEPVREAFWMSEEWRAANLRYYPYYGRGYIQCTWQTNYESGDQWIGDIWNNGTPVTDSVANPDNMLDPDYSAAFAATYFRNHGGYHSDLIPDAARRGDWTEVRRLVQGGTAGLPRLIAIANALAEPAPVPAPPSLDLAKYVFPVDGYDQEVQLHWGVFEGGSDIFAERGTPVRAVGSGTVIYREEGGSVGGNAVEIEHDDDGLVSYYAHGQSPPNVQLGEHVDAGTFLFGVGDSGNARAAGPHLHFGMGRSIILGSGPQGGCGSDFDAVGFLRSLREYAPFTPTSDPRAGLISALGYLGGDVANRLGVVELRLEAPPTNKPVSKMLKADWRQRAEFLEKRLTDQASDIRAIKEEMMRVAQEALR
jgi:murein DD-endopeptidase MepM/ murein hydrolase activator NlpD